MTDNNVRIHLEPTPRHKHTLAAVTHCTTMIVWAGVDFLCRLPLVFISFDSFFLLSVLHCVCFFWLVLAWCRFFFRWHISPCPISVLRHCDQACDCCFMLSVVLWNGPFVRRRSPHFSDEDLKRESLSHYVTLLIRMSCGCRYTFGFALLCVLCLVLHELNYFMFIVLDMFAPWPKRLHSHISCEQFQCSQIQQKETERSKEVKKRVEMCILGFDWYKWNSGRTFLVLAAWR